MENREWLPTRVGNFATLWPAQTRRRASYTPSVLAILAAEYQRGV